MQARLYEDEYWMWHIMGAMESGLCMIMRTHRPFLGNKEMLHLLAASALFKDLDQIFSTYPANNFVFLYSQMNFFIKKNANHNNFFNM